MKRRPKPYLVELKPDEDGNRVHDRVVCVEAYCPKAAAVKAIDRFGLVSIGIMQFVRILVRSVHNCSDINYAPEHTYTIGFRREVSNVWQD